MTADEEGFLYPVVDEVACIKCGLCERVCVCLHHAEREQGTPKAYAAYNRNEEVRLASSSGGVFTLLAEYVLEQKGVIYGAAMENFRVKHIRVSDSEGLALLRGSKYVQSDIGQTYLQAKADLEAGKIVLFTGTPCQIEGIKSFLRKDYKNLITMDIICHGVPSPMVWDRYVAYREKEAGAPATRMFFRHKEYGWKTYAVLFEFSNNTAYVRRLGDDLFMQVFLHDLCLRPSCYACNFKTIYRTSDITVADFWGIETVCPELDDDKGASLVLIHSKRGKELFSAIQGKLCCKAVALDEALRGNPAINHSAQKPKDRDAFMKDILHDSFEVTVHRYGSKCRNGAYVIKGILKRLGLLDFVKRILKKG